MVSSPLPSREQEERGEGAERSHPSSNKSPDRTTPTAMFLPFLTVLNILEFTVSSSGPLDCVCQACLPGHQPLRKCGHLSDDRDQPPFSLLPQPAGWVPGSSAKERWRGGGHTGGGFSLAFLAPWHCGQAFVTSSGFSFSIHKTRKLDPFS